MNYLKITSGLCLALSLFFAIPVSAQVESRIDSLVIKLGKTTDNKEKVQILTKLTELNSIVDPAAGIAFGKKALSYMKVGNWTSPRIDVLQNMGMCLRSQGNLPEALTLFYQSMELSQKASLPDQSASVARQLGMTYKQQRNRVQAEKYYQEAFSHYEKTGDSFQISVLHIDLGGLCSDHGDLSCAKRHYERALAIINSGKSVSRKALVISNLANVYGAEGNYRKAVQFYEDALALLNAQNDTRKEMFIYGQLGFEYLNFVSDTQPVPDEFKLDGSRDMQISKAIEYISKAANYFQQAKQVNEYQAFMRALPEAYFLGKQYEKGIEAFKSYYESKENTIQKQRESELARAELNYEYNRRKDSTQQVQERKELALENEMKFREIEFAYQKKQQALTAERERFELKFSEAVKRKELETAHEKTREQEKLQTQRLLRITWILAGSIAVVLLILYLIRVARLESRKAAMEKNFSQNLVQTIESERKRIAEELHDSIGQSLLLLKNKLHHEQRDTVTVDAIIGEVRGLSHDMHPYQFERLGLMRSTRETVEALQQHSDIFFSFDCEDETLGDSIAAENQIHIYRMLQEALNNVLKHSGAKACRVSVDEKGDAIEFEVKDNGTGFEPSRDGFESLGLKTMESRARLTGSDLAIKSTAGKGTSVVVLVKKSKQSHG
ncbi:tetratricopeptide repeat-containing sensor histidine kinase [Flavobacterium selenitireducens]|uniref:tetratricopeptide repeat-containing sensor histidine kinase n=1 Tax=Flavobacterium selenitireducens TaxID=2722704 RepID=UPI00168BD8D2|nr:tetratricopeptide repeat-containing sensor histidine kinase [Flavobacterium selenitireducens]MBD3583512.1 tetratricopeptide repeat protein [Flavobacterium selenitireducens]